MAMQPPDSDSAPTLPFHNTLHPPPSVYSITPLYSITPALASIPPTSSVPTAAAAAVVTSHTQPHPTEATQTPNHQPSEIRHATTQHATMQQQQQQQQAAALPNIVQHYIPHQLQPPPQQSANDSDSQQSQSSSSPSAHSHSHSPHFVPIPHSSLVPSKPLHKPVKSACCACRKLKAACDDQRPCGRCARFGRDCIDRSEEEKVAAKARRKRQAMEVSPHSLAAHATAAAAIVTATATAAAMPAIASTPATNTATATAAIPTMSTVATPVLSAANHNNNINAPPINAGPSIVNPLYITSSPAEDDCSRQQFSSICLSTLLHENVRDSLLKTHSQLDSLPLEMSCLLEFHTQCAIFLTHLSGLMLPADFHDFLVHGLTESQLNSPLFLSSPLAAWTKLSTRPLYIVVHPLTQQVESTQNDHPELRTQMLPLANHNYQRWQRQMLTKILFERELRTGREIHPVNVHRTQTPSFRSWDMITSAMAKDPLQHPPPLESQSRTHTPLPLKVEPTISPFSSSSSSISSSSSNSTASLPPANAPTNEHLEHAFTLLDLCPSLTAPPAPEHAHEIVQQPLHARWCPMFAEMLQLEDDPSTSVVARKVKRQEGMTSVHSTPTKTNSIATTLTSTTTASEDGAGFELVSSCICSLSTPLPVHFIVNKAWEDAFGWTRAEAERAMQVDGLIWIRHLSSPCSWYSFHLKSVQHWKRHLEFVGHMALVAAHTAAGINIPQAISQVIPWSPHTAVIRTKRGEIRPEVYRKIFSVKWSDGVDQRSALVISWIPMKEEHDQSSIHKPTPCHTIQSTPCPTIQSTPSHAYSQPYAHAFSTPRPAVHPIPPQSIQSTMRSPMASPLHFQISTQPQTHINI